MTIHSRQILLTTVAVSLGWGLRGTIGGGPVGAMIPGALLGLCLGKIWLMPMRQLALFTAFCTLGMGLGGQETYGQTIGLLRKSNTAAWGLLGLTIKGAVWGLSAAIFIWAGSLGPEHPARHRWTALALQAFFTVVGWKLVNEPRLIYFSDPVNKPREEIWFGLLLGPLVAGTYLATLGLKKQVFQFLASSFLAGAAGFGGGSLWLLIGLNLPEPYNRGPWWKCMEFSFGACLGLGFSLAAKFLPVSLQPEMKLHSRSIPPGNFAAGAMVVLAALGIQFNTEFRLTFSILAPLLILLVSFMPELAWHVALSFTITAFFRDYLYELDEKMNFSVEFWHVAILTIITVSFIEWFTNRASTDANRLIMLISLSGTTTCFLKVGFINGEGYVVPAIFLMETIAVCILCLLKGKPEEELLLPVD